MRGQIYVASEYGRGTKFFFTVLVGRAGTREVEEYRQQDVEQRAAVDLAGSDAPGRSAGRGELTSPTHPILSYPILS